MPCCSRDFVDDSVEDCFADSANLGFGGVDQSAGRFVNEVRFVVSQSYEWYSTPRVCVNCEDELHTLRRTVVRRTYTTVLRARWKKMCNSCAFVIQYYKYPLHYIGV